jgi:hypothetical protein
MNTPSGQLLEVQKSNGEVYGMTSPLSATVDRCTIKYTLTSPRLSICHRFKQLENGF